MAPRNLPPPLTQLDRGPEAPAIPVARVAVWVAVLVGVAAVGAVWAGTVRRAAGPPQETAASATAAVCLLGLYVAARAVERLLGAFGR